MNVPRFTAQASLYTSQEGYHAQLSATANQQVIPQLINIGYIGCWVTRAVRTYSRCISLGYGAGECAETASDLATSVCS
jgi:hypothetical protein